MIGSDTIRLLNEALWLVLMLSAPPIVVASLVGLGVAILQAATQIQEQTFQYMLKFFAIVLTIFTTMTLLGGTLYHFADTIFAQFYTMVR